MVMLYGLRADRCPDVGLAGPGSTNQHDVVGRREELTPAEAHQCFADFTACKVEAHEISIRRKLGHLYLIGPRAYLALSEFAAETNATPKRFAAQFG